MHTFLSRFTEQGQVKGSVAAELAERCISALEETFVKENAVLDGMSCPCTEEAETERGEGERERAGEQEEKTWLQLAVERVSFIGDAV